MKKVIILLAIFSYWKCIGQITTEERQVANAFFISSDWSNAKTAYEKICETEPTNWQAKNRLGVALSEMGNTRKAISILEESVKLSNNNAQPLYHLARAYARSGEPDMAFKHLDLSMTNGFAQLTRFENDSMLTPLKKDPRL
ncbi:MAG: tetratricopeptide repeat protein [Flammeovirgaceae bacterium]|nr:tetratricopeptide repeat protein [Flammeovirgaceae bacterium]